MLEWNAANSGMQKKHPAHLLLYQIPRKSFLLPRLKQDFQLNIPPFILFVSFSIF